MIGKFVGQIVTRLIASAGLDAKLTKLLENNDKRSFWKCILRHAHDHVRL